MPYLERAHSKSQMLIVYVLDMSTSMSQPLDGRRRMDVVFDALWAAFRRMVARSMRGVQIMPRYRVAMYAYSDRVHDVLGGAMPVDQAVIGKGIPDLTPGRVTNTARAFESAEQLLRVELPILQGCPAPLVCHMTDGEYTGDDPEPIANRIKAMRVRDGNVLVQNIFISDRIVPETTIDPNTWPGISPSSRLVSDYARKLRTMSSPLPASYRDELLKSSYNLAPDAVMLLPGISADLVSLGFQMSMATPNARTTSF